MGDCAQVPKKSQTKSCPPNEKTGNSTLKPWLPPPPEGVGVAAGELGSWASSPSARGGDWAQLTCRLGLAFPDLEQQQQREQWAGSKDPHGVHSTENGVSGAAGRKGSRKSDVYRALILHDRHVALEVYFADLFLCMSKRFLVKFIAVGLLGNTRLFVELKKVSLCGTVEQ